MYIEIGARCRWDETRARRGSGGERGGARGLLKRHCREGLSAGGRGEGTHPKHVFHDCDLGRVEGQRLVEGRCVLPGRKVGIRGEGEVRAGR